MRNPRWVHATGTYLQIAHFENLLEFSKIVDAIRHLEYICVVYKGAEAQCRLGHCASIPHHLITQVAGLMYSIVFAHLVCAPNRRAFTQPMRSLRLLLSVPPRPP